jgi:DNA polymerase
MQKEMPKRYWKNLPEAQLIDPLAASAAVRSQTMIDRTPDPTRRRLSAAEPRPAPEPPATPADAEPASLPALRDALERCRECPIGEHATQAVPGEGPARARLMFVGEQPGDQEDLQGRPFVGPAGQLFARALGELGIARHEVYITNAVKHFKFELRGQRRIHKTPAQQEAAACLHWLDSEIGLVDPEALVALGATAARQLMGRTVAVTRERGRWLKRSDGRRVLITLHPSALLRMEPEDKADAYRAWLDDLRQVAGPRSSDPP